MRQPFKAEAGSWQRFGSWMTPATSIRSEWQHTTPMFHPLLYAFLSSKKAFTPSHEGSLRLVFRCFRCEGFDFQVFTPKRSKFVVFHWFSTIFRCKGLPFQPFTSIHRPCEGLKIKAFTVKTDEYQQKTRPVWRGEYLFREIKTVYTRARKGDFSNTWRHFQHGKMRRWWGIRWGGDEVTQCGNISAINRLSRR